MSSFFCIRLFRVMPKTGETPRVSYSYVTPNHDGSLTTLYAGAEKREVQKHTLN